MKLKTYNITNTAPQRKAGAYIHMNSKTGLIFLTVGFVGKCDITAKSLVQFVQNEEDETEWYLEVVDKNGFALKRGNEKKTKGLHLCNSSIVRSIFKSVGFEGNSGRLPLGELVILGKRNLFTLITAGLRNQ